MTRKANKSRLFMALLHVWAGGVSVLAKILNRETAGYGLTLGRKKKR